jgi:hypothetical protein
MKFYINILIAIVVLAIIGVIVYVWYFNTDFGGDTSSPGHTTYTDSYLADRGITPVTFQPGTYQYTDKSGTVHTGTPSQLIGQQVLFP